MPLNVKCKNCNNYRNSWCERVIDSPDPDMVRDCRHFWEKTNADRIRAMSDEELAEIIHKIAFDVYNCNECQSHLMTTLKCCDMCDNRCGNCVLSWLKQHAEVNDNEKS